MVQLTQQATLRAPKTLIDIHRRLSVFNCFRFIDLHLGRVSAPCFRFLRPSDGRWFGQNSFDRFFTDYERFVVEVLLQLCVGQERSLHVDELLDL